MSKIGRVYNYRRDDPEERAKYAHFTHNQMFVHIADTVDLRPFFYGDVLDQGQVSSCTANAGAHSLRFWPVSKPNQTPLDISRLFLYYYSRLNAGDQPPLTDNGCTCAATTKTLSTMGSPVETLWPYDPTQVNDQPPSDCTPAALSYIPFKLTYYPITSDLTHIKSCLSTGHVIQLGIDVYESFETPAVAANGVVPMPDFENEQLLGGHSVVICGYTADHFILVNSWGSGWGDKGFFYLPFAYLPHMYDLWTYRAAPVTTSTSSPAVVPSAAVHVAALSHVNAHTGPAPAHVHDHTAPAHIHAAPALASPSEQQDAPAEPEPEAPAAPAEPTPAASRPSRTAPYYQSVHSYDYPFF